MGFKEIGKSVSQTLTTTLNKVHGALFSAPDLSEAATKFTKALNGEEYHPDAGVIDTFDTNSTEGREYINDTRLKLLSARSAYNNAFSGTPNMRDADEILGADFGIDVDGLIIDSQKVSALTTPSTSNHDFD